MIPFFRKIRKKMADDNRPLKYARYTRVYKKSKDKGWQMITLQATEIHQ